MGRSSSRSGPVLALALPFGSVGLELSAGAADMVRASGRAVPSPEPTEMGVSEAVSGSAATGFTWWDGGDSGTVSSLGKRSGEGVRGVLGVERVEKGSASSMVLGDRHVSRGGCRHQQASRATGAQSERQRSGVPL